MRYRTKLTFKIYWKHIKKYRGALSGVLAFIALGDGFALIVPYIYKKIVDSMIMGVEVQTLIVLLAWSFGAATVHHLSIRAALYFNAYFQTRVMRDLADTSFQYLHKHSFSFFHNNFVGSLVKRVNRFYRSFERLADRYMWDFFPTAYNVIVVIVILSFRHVLFGIVISAWVFVYVYSNFVFSKYKLKYDVERAKQDSRTTGVLADTVTNQGNVKLLVGYDREVLRFFSESDTLNRLRKFTLNIHTHFEVFQGFLMIGLEIGLMYLAIRLWEAGQLTVGDFVLIQAYISTIFHRLWGFGRVIRDTYESLADAEEMTEIFDTPHEVQDARQAQGLEISNATITFTDVSFAYHKTRMVIKGFDLDINAGERIALVGPSGAGKSTIIKLLLRQHDVTSGKILIDDTLIGKVTLESLWKNISLVPQDPILFHRSLLENIRYGMPDATDDEVKKAAHSAHADEFILETPLGYDTMVGERGVKLSGGERQRVAIARAILRNAPILILDEATSSLDSESEGFIQDALDVLMKGKTVIVVAHRLSTIMKMDRILVIDDGKIAEEGTHKQLLRKKSGLYKKLWDIQVGGFIA
jgi:ATP-binding cassette, subfamily B, bacterial